MVGIGPLALLAFPARDQHGRIAGGRPALTPLLDFFELETRQSGDSFDSRPARDQAI
jgi:hypothetical protein